jgi:hypothetical protein
MRDAAFDTGVIIADAVALAELPGGTGHEGVRIDWLHKRLTNAPGSRHVDDVGNLVWTFGPPPYRLAVLVHVDDVFDEATVRGVTRRDGWLCGPGIGDNAIAVATAVAERSLISPVPMVVVFTVGEEGLGGVRGACRIRRATARPTRTRRSRPAYRRSPSAAARARTCTPRPNPSWPAPSPPAPPNCAPSRPRS